MRLELLPVIIGGIVALLGLGLVLDGWIADETFVARERRRRPRQERSRGGEVLLGLGILAMAAALIARDLWRYSIVTAIAGAVLLLLGSWANRRYLRELLSTRGKSRRGMPTPRPEKTRIR